MTDIDHRRPSAFPPETMVRPVPGRTMARRRHWTNDWRGGLALVGVCLGLHLPGIWSLPPIDRDEARFAEASRRMAAAETWRERIVPMIQDKPRLKKPPLTYWLQAPAAAAAGVHARPDPWSGGIWAYRLPSVLAALGAVLLTWRIGRRMFAPPCGWLAGVLLAACAVVLFDVRQARADQLLLFFTTLGYDALWRIWRGPSSATTPLGRVLLFWTAVALGILAKGPITAALIVLSALALGLATRDADLWRRLRPGLGIVVVAVLALPWFVAVAVALGWQKLALAFLGEVLLRSVKAMESHGGPPGLYLVLLPVLFWPGSLALVPGLWRAWRRGVRVTPAGADRRRWFRRLRAGRAAELFCLAWLLPGWVVFELIVTKLPHYPLPLFPALALLTARGLCDRRAWHTVLNRRLGRAAVIAWVVLTELLAVGVPAVLMALGRTPDGGTAWARVALPVLVAQAGVVGGALELRRRRFLRGQLLFLGAAGAAAVTLFARVLPAHPSLWLSSRLNTLVHQVDPEARRPLAATGYQEDSLVFLTQGRVRKLAPDEVAAWWQANPRGLLIAAPPPDAPGLLRLAELDGFNYGAGRRVRVALMQRTTGPDPASDERPPGAAPP